MIWHGIPRLHSNFSMTWAFRLIYIYKYTSNWATSYIGVTSAFRCSYSGQGAGDCLPHPTAAVAGSSIKMSAAPSVLQQAEGRWVSLSGSKLKALKLGGDESHEFPRPGFHVIKFWWILSFKIDVPLVVHHVHHGFDLRPLFGLICLHPSSPALKTLRTCKLESTST